MTMCNRQLRVVRKYILKPKTLLRLTEAKLQLTPTNSNHVCKDEKTTEPRTQYDNVYFIEHIYYLQSKNHTNNEQMHIVGTVGLTCSWPIRDEQWLANQGRKFRTPSNKR